MNKQPQDALEVLEKLIFIRENLMNSMPTKEAKTDLHNALLKLDEHIANLINTLELTP